MSGSNALRTLFAFTTLAFTGLVHAQQPVTNSTEELAAAIQLYIEGDFVGAQHALNDIDPADLDVTGRATHAEYVEIVDAAVRAFRKAEADYEAALLAASEGQVREARRLLQSVLDNQFTSKGTRRRARTELIKLESAPAQQPPPMDPSDSVPAERQIEELVVPPGEIEQQAPPSEEEDTNQSQATPPAGQVVSPSADDDSQDGAQEESPSQQDTDPSVQDSDEPSAASPPPPAETDSDLTTPEMMDESPAETADTVDPEIARQRATLLAKVLTREAYDAIAAGRMSEAERLFRRALEHVPGFPEAVAGLGTIKDHEIIDVEARALSERIRRRNAIAWQRTVTTMREAEREVRQHVMADDFDLANQTVLRARQIVESGKQYAEPVARYEALLHDVGALEKYVDNERRLYEESRISRLREDARSESANRVRQMRRSKDERINALMQQALDHRHRGEYESAVNVLNQVVAIDTGNDNARWRKEIIEDQLAYQTQRELRDEFTRQTQNVLIDVQKSRVPWWQDITYPKNWQEIINRPTRARPGTDSAGAIDPNLQSVLDKPNQVDFNGDPFGDAIQQLADANKANITVSWSDLASSGIRPDSPVRLKLTNPVPLRTALREVLDQVGGNNAELAYLPVDGVIKVATRQKLDRHVYEHVYDARDLLMPIPDFDDAPSMDLSDPATFAKAREMSNSSGGVVYPEGFSEYSEEIIQEEADSLIALIRDTIDPESWRSNGGNVGSIREINGQLVITQTPTGHSRVGGLLSKLREQRAIQVAIEARFITVQSNYLEELGLDLDVVLNAGNAGFDFLENPDNRGSLLLDPVLGSRLLLPRSFSRLGFTPGTPGVGNALSSGSTGGLVQPFNTPGLVPQRGNSLTSGGSASPIPLINNVLQFTDPGSLTSDLPGSFAGNPTLGPAFSVFGSFLDNIQVDFLIRATQADSRTSLLTAPRLVLFNGQRAWVAVVNQQSFVGSLQPVVDAQGQQPIIQTIETGAVLDAQVTVSSDKRYVTMTLRPSVGRLLGLQTFAFTTGANAGEGSFVQLPNISRQVLRTTVTVPDGGTLLIGGQKLAGEIEVESGVPILSKIPILKRLYSSKTLVRDEQVLLILIKPKIIIQSEAEQQAFPTFSQN